MTIGLLHLEFMIPGARSLKDKRRATKSFRDQVRNRYNCSIAEVGMKEKWGRAHFAACVVSDDAAHANTQLNEIARFATVRANMDLTHYEIEML